MSAKPGVLVNLPDELHFLIDAALKYGYYKSDSERDKKSQKLAEPDLEALASIAERYRLAKQHRAVDVFFDQYSISTYSEAAKLYWLFALLDELGFEISDSAGEVDHWIEQLHEYGSERAAFGRARAAMVLADFGQPAAKAIATLKKCLGDKELFVQAWAHYALAILEGNKEAHKKAIEQIFNKYSKKDEDGLFIDPIGAEADAALEKLAES
ncbi:MAG: hypothetical protein K2X38_22205 [Gemmataceae bacterium]|nr:hypothetical protein [Gemmataceae bacterium]